MQRIEINVVTGEKLVIDLTAEEIAELPAPDATMQTEIDSASTVEEITAAMP